MNNINEFVKDELLCHGADLVGFGDLTQLPPDIRCSLPVGIAVAVKYPKDVIKGIEDMPTKEYYDQYNILNKKLDMLVTLGTETLHMLGYEAVAQTMDYVKRWETVNESRLPHKTVATRAALGWIGKSALLVTEKYGSMVRISSILTNAPLKTAKPINKSKCGDCLICTDACPAGAVLGKNWSVDTYRDEFFNAPLCRKVARDRAMQSFGVEITNCGKCIVVCPYTQKYLNDESNKKNG